ncbi:MAG: TolC family protein [Saprospiraceae bacterium]|nr:TolC family protein [Saprospiraceae bacterium]
MIEADREVDREMKEQWIQYWYGRKIRFSQTDPALNKAYQDLLDQERLSIGLQIPIADWGRARARRETAKSNRELIQMNVEQEQINLEREIILRVQQFELVKNRVNLSKKSLDIAVKRQEMTRQRYLIGKIGITDLNIALSELDAARRGYIDAQREFWVALYEIRGLTLYDFVEGKPLILEPETN